MKKFSLSLLLLTSLLQNLSINTHVSANAVMNLNCADVRLIEELLIFDQTTRSLVVYIRNLRNNFLLRKISYNGQEITLKELANIAQKMREEGKDLDADMMAIFDELVIEFKELSEPFLEVVREGKSVLVRIVEEWIKKRQVSDTNLQRWMETPEGQEEALFHDAITSPIELHEFLHDLFVFLSDLMNSCPRAIADYQLTNKKLTKLQHIAHEVMKKSPTLALENKDFTRFLCWSKASFIRNVKLEALTRPAIAKHLHTFVRKHK